MKVVTVVGARPQFIKAAVVSRLLRKEHTEILVHTGQHFDHNMSELFFEELEIPKPNYNLGISGGSHAQMTGRMMIAIEEVLQKEMPDWLLVYGDTNSTLAAALTAAKLHIPVCHVEAGARTHDKSRPEELNRILTDHVGTLLLAGTKSAMKELEKENLIQRSEFVGDPMYDAFLTYSQKQNINDIRLQLLDGGEISVPSRFYYMTCHREHNTQNDETLGEILRAVNTFYPSIMTVYPVHPRNREQALRLRKQYEFPGVIFVQPVGYIESVCLVRHAEKIVTDSGGLQREAFFAGVKCVTISNYIGCPETLEGNRNSLAYPLADDIIRKLAIEQTITLENQPFGDGRSAEKIVASLTRKKQRESLCKT